MIKSLCSQKCWKSLLGIFFLFLSLGGFAIELQDQHHHYSYSVEDIDEIEEEESNEEDLHWNLGSLPSHGGYLELHQEKLETELSITRMFQSFQFSNSGKLLCILLHQLKYDSCL